MSERVTIYGIKACDTMKKARDWLAGHAVNYEFHDYKVQGVDRAKLEDWSRSVGWETLLNRSGTTFRKLPDADKIGLPVSVFVAVETADHSSEWLGRFAKVIQDTPEVVDAWRMSGDVDYLLHVVVADIASYDLFYRKLIAAQEK